MHPMFARLFIETDADDLLTEEQDRKRRARGQARQAGPAREGRRYPRSSAPPLTYDPAPVTESRWPRHLVCSAAGAQPYRRAGTFCGRLRRGRYRARTSPAAPDPPQGPLEPALWYSP
jgi:hypothetical protein